MTKPEFKALEATSGTYAAAWIACQLGVSLSQVQLWRIAK